VFCRRRVADLAERLGEFRALGADVVAIGRGTPAMAADARRETGWPGVLLVDGDGAAFRAAGTRRTTILSALRPSVWRAALAARRRGLRQGKTGPDPWGLGATIVIAPRGRVLFEHRNRSIEDDAPVEDVLAAVRAARGSAAG
jgi:peroxiredoxin